MSVEPEVEEGRGGEARMTLVEHLAELRNRLLKCLAAVVGGAVVAWILYPQIFDFLLEPYCRVSEDGECALYITDPLEGFATRLKIAVYGGVALAMPVLLWQLWRFITPGLYPKERRYAVPFIVSAISLFFLGAALAYWTLPRALDFLIRVGGEDLGQIFSPAKYLSLVTYMMLAFGIGFEFPILLIFLQLAGVVSNEALRRWRRYAIVGIVVVVAIITPSGDPISLLMLSVPMYVFYELAILLGRILVRRRAAAA